MLLVIFFLLAKHWKSEMSYLRKAKTCSVNFILFTSQSQKWLVEIENQSAKTEVLLVCGQLTTVSVKPWFRLCKNRLWRCSRFDLENVSAAHLSIFCGFICFHVEKSNFHVKTMLDWRLLTSQLNCTVQMQFRKWKICLRQLWKLESHIHWRYMPGL